MPPTLHHHHRDVTVVRHTVGVWIPKTGLHFGLRFGGNDVGSVMLEENVVRAAGVTNCTSEEELRRIIRDAGFRPVQRDTLYSTYFLN